MSVSSVLLAGNAFYAICDAALLIIPVVVDFAGAIGINKFSCDVRGDAVNIASRLEGNGVRAGARFRGLFPEAERQLQV